MFSMEKIKVDRLQTQRMLHGFYDFYSTFNFKEYAICTYLGILVTRSSLKSKMPARYVRHAINCKNHTSIKFSIPLF